MKTTFTTFSSIERLLPLAFIASAITGIGLHLASHGTHHEVWHNWAVAHVIASFFWVASAMCHVRRFRNWYKGIPKRGLSAKRRTTLCLSVIFLAVVSTGIVLLAYVDGANSAVGLWHYRLGFLLIALSLLHAGEKKRRKRL